MIGQPPNFWTEPVGIYEMSKFLRLSALAAAAVAFTATVGISKDGTTFNCDGGSGNVTCSGPHQVAVYNVSGTKSQPVTIAAGNVTLKDAAGDVLTLVPDFTSTVNLTNSGAPGDDFNVGGSISVSDATPDGVYTGTFAVTAEYP